MFLEFKDVKIRYGDRLIIQDVNLGVPEGKIVSLVGKNGSGKSSLLKILTNTVKKENGEVYIRGRNIKQYKRKELAQLMAVLPQVYESPSDIDVETMVGYGRFPYKKFGRKYSPSDEAVIEDTLQLTNLQTLRYQQIQTLSGGERQRTRLAMAICQQPQILILDEPTTYLDIAYQIEVLDLIKRINQELGMSILMVLHDLNLASKYSDLIYVLDQQEVAHCGDADDIICPSIINSVFHIDIALWEDNPSGKPHFMPLGVQEKRKEEKTI